MNALESYTITTPDGNTGECAKFVIDNLNQAFVLNNITTAGQNYSFSFWVRSDIDSSIFAAGTIFSSSTEWAYYSTTFVATSSEFRFHFSDTGNYYIYQPQLESGTIVTDYKPATEDMASMDDINSTNDRIQEVYEFTSELSIESSEIRASVSSVEASVDTLSGEIAYTKSEIASMKLESDGLKIELENISANGAKQVTTETGFTFDHEGLTIDSSDSSTKTQVTPDGMTVYAKDANGTENEVLEATSDGVDATNLHAKTFLIIGGRSRFENYGDDRTGCFWIGG